MDQAPLCLQVSLVYFMTSHFRDKLEATTTPDQLAFLESYGRHMVARCCLVALNLWVWSDFVICLIEPTWLLSHSSTACSCM